MWRDQQRGWKVAMLKLGTWEIWDGFICVYIYICECVYIFFIFICHTHTCIYIYIEREREIQVSSWTVFGVWFRRLLLAKCLDLYCSVYAQHLYTIITWKQIYVLCWSSSRAWGMHLRTYLPILQQLQKVDISQVKCCWENWYGEGFELKRASSKQNFILSLLLFCSVLGTIFFIWYWRINPPINGF